tara:strand:+ start:410 stop:670 length:261 start_codon:yes stop_codon:yes gene_type:complete
MIKLGKLNIEKEDLNLKINTEFLFLIVLLRIVVIWATFAIFSATIVILLAMMIVGAVIVGIYFIFYYIYLIVAFGCFGYTPSSSAS